MKIEPIETKYKGYRFRSRLEARWAVFFDTLGIKWEYESEGYDLGEAGWYLPDFWLPEFMIWVEIKPEGNHKHKCGEFRDAVGPILLCVGLPTDKDTCVLYTHDSTDGGGGSNEFECLFTDFLTNKDGIYLIDAVANGLIDGPTLHSLVCPVRLVVFDTNSSRTLLSYPLVGAPSHDKVVLLRDMFNYVNTQGNCCEKEEKIHKMLIKNKKYLRACIAARSVRFERGEVSP